LDFRREGFSPSLSLLMSAFALPMPPPHLAMRLRRPRERSATTRPFGRIHSFGTWLEPRYIFAAGQLVRPVSYYAFFLALFVATHVRILTSHASTAPRGCRFAGLGNAPLPVRDPEDRTIHSFGTWLEPRYIFAAGQLVRPVSYYAFFKGWLLLSQPPGCCGRPTCFPT
jgi:hypothetical protein